MKTFAFIDASNLFYGGEKCRNTEGRVSVFGRNDRGGDVILSEAKNPEFHPVIARSSSDEAIPLMRHGILHSVQDDKTDVILSEAKNPEVVATNTRSFVALLLRMTEKNAKDDKKNSVILSETKNPEVAAMNTRDPCLPDRQASFHSSG